MHIRRVLALGAAGSLVTIAAVIAAAPPSSAQPFTYSSLNAIQKRLISGSLSEALDTSPAAVAQRAAGPTSPQVLSTPQRPGPHGCPGAIGHDVKVNQNCLNLTDADLPGRGQAQNETWIAADPNNADHVIASYNDYRRGDSTCGTTYSQDAGKNWADSTVPNGFVRGAAFGGAARQYFQGSGDTSVAYDSRGNAYLSCQMFSRGANGVTPNPDQSSGLYVFRSTGTNGASWNFPARAVAENNDVAGQGNVLLDKQLMAVDSATTSRFRDRVYVTWTTFAADGTAYIYGAYSKDYGESFSPPVLISRDSATCGNTFGLPTPQGRCNENQFSQPFTGSDGTLYVTYANFNKKVQGADNRSQVFLARSTDGGASYSNPALVGDYYELPDCQATQGQDAGRACVPERGGSKNSYFRASQYPIGAIDPTNPKRVLVTYGSYLNRDSNESTGCTPTGLSALSLNTYRGAKDGGCNNDIIVSTSTDGARTFSGGAIDPRMMPVVTTDNKQAKTSQFWQNAAFAPDGTFVVAYYDRQYGNDETTGYSDISLSTSTDRSTYTHRRVTSSSMPPPTQFLGTFMGDYMGLAVSASAVHPLWTDTRTVDEFLCPGTAAAGTPPRVCTGSAPNAPIANDQDAFSQRLPLKAG